MAVSQQGHISMGKADGTQRWLRKNSASGDQKSSLSSSSGKTLTEVVDTFQKVWSWNGINKYKLHGKQKNLKTIAIKTIAFFI